MRPIDTCSRQKEHTPFVIWSIWHDGFRSKQFPIECTLSDAFCGKLSVSIYVDYYPDTITTLPVDTSRHQYTLLHYQSTPVTTTHISHSESLQVMTNHSNYQSLLFTPSHHQSLQITTSHSNCQSLSVIAKHYQLLPVTTSHYYQWLPVDTIHS